VFVATNSSGEPFLQQLNDKIQHFLKQNEEKIQQLTAALEKQKRLEETKDMPGVGEFLDEAGKNQNLNVLQSNLHEYTLQENLKLEEEKRKLRAEELQTKLGELESKVKAFMDDTAAIVIEEESKIVNKQTEISATIDNIAEKLDTGAICDDQKLVDQEELTSLKFFWQYPLQFLLQCLIDIKRSIFSSPNDTHTIGEHGSITVGKSIAGKPFGIPDDVWWEYQRQKITTILKGINNEGNHIDNPEYKVEYIDNYKTTSQKYIDYKNYKTKSKEIESLLKKGEELLAECEAFNNKDNVEHEVEFWQEKILRGKEMLNKEQPLRYTF